jgi:adenylate cyclase
MRVPAYLAKPGPFTIGLLATMAAVLIYHSFGARKPELLASLDNRVTTSMFQWRGARPTTGQVVIIDIDEKSIGRLGQWPWPRDTVAELVRQIERAGAKVLGFDIVFAEPDRTSPKNFLERLRQDLSLTIPAGRLDKLDHDKILGAALTTFPAVLGYVFQTADDGLKSERTPFPSALIRPDPPGARLEDLPLVAAYRAILNVEAISQAESEGFFNVFPDSDGTVRKIPLFIQMDRIPYPSLALEMARVGMAEQALLLRLDQGGILGVSLGERFLPTDERGQITVNYRGPAYTFPYLPAADILAGHDLERLRDKYVLIGTSAAGLLDLRATPFSNVFPGVEAHATLIDNILRGDSLVHDNATEIGLTYLTIILGGLLLSLLLARGNALAGGLGIMLLTGGMVAGNYRFFFLQNQVVGLVYPLAAILTLFMVVTLFNYFFEGRKKRSISKAFSQYVPPELVDELAGSMDDLALGGETRQMTVLFSDVRGFTSISEGLDAQELTHLMNAMLTPMTRIIHHNRGTIDKYMGDAIMAFWGAPLHDQNHARHGLMAGLAMVAEIPRLQQAFAAKGWPPIKIGVGLNTGPMNVGNMGSEFRMAYTVLGDAVNLGARLEGLTKQYGIAIMVSEFTKAQVSDFAFRELDLVKVKGKEEPVAIFEPIGPAADLLNEEAERLVVHHRALNHYRAQEWDAAEALFAQLHQEEPERQLYSLYLSRITNLRESPPPPDWDGSFTCTTK